MAIKKAHCKKADSKQQWHETLGRAGAQGRNERSSGDAWDKDDIPGRKKRGREAGFKKDKARSKRQGKKEIQSKGKGKRREKDESERE